MKNFTLKICFALVLFCTTALSSLPLLAQQTVTLKPINGTGKDAGITTQCMDTNYATHPDFEASTWTCSSVLCLSRSLIEFDLSFIPAGSVINSATLYLYANNNAPNCILGQPTYGTANAGYLKRITQSWNLNTVTWNTQPTTTTQNQVTVPQSTNTSENYVINVTTLTQDIIDNPSSGFGFMMSEQNETTWYNSLIFCSSDIADTSLAPALTVTYTAPGQICFELQPNAADGKDAGITTQCMDTNYATHPDFEATTWTCSSVLCLSRSILEFDLSSIPATAHIDSAILYLYANPNAPNCIVGQPTYGTNNAGYLRRVTQPWNENTITWNNAPTFTTQDEVTVPQSTNTMQNYVLDIKNLMQTSIQNPTTSFGFIMMEQNETTWYNSLIFASSDYPDSTLHPKLKVCYTPSTGITETDFSSISVYPNPFTNSIIVNDKDHSVKAVQIFSVIGEEIYSETRSTRAAAFTIELPQLSSGIYFARIITDKGIVVKKIVKEN